MDIKEFKDQLKELLVINNHPLLFTNLKKNINTESSLHDEAILLQSSIEQVETETRRQIISFENYTLVKNQIRNSILSLINQITKADVKFDNNESFTLLSSRNILIIVFNDTQFRNQQFFTDKLNLKTIEIKYSNEVESLNNKDVIIYDNTDLAPAFNPKVFQNLQEKDPSKAQIITDRILFMEQFVEEPKKIFLHYGEQLYWLNNHRDKFSAANSPYTYLARIREIIEYTNMFF